jgi:serine/threonine protein kinase
VPYVERLASGLEPFPGYCLRHRLGSGGFGEVWEAETPLGRAVALKFLPCDNPQAAAMEIRSLQAVRQLRHPNLVRVDQVWSHLGYIVVAMELADGSLADLLEVYQTEVGTPIIPEHVCHLLSQAAVGLDYLNARQHTIGGQCVAIRHCDVKPSNLLIFGESVKLTDFGLSSLTTAEIQVHRRAGTLDYTAPEVFQGQLSEQTDQFALAVSYCRLRTGRLPFPETPPSFQVNYVRPPPDLSILPEPEQPIIARALNVVPQNRWASCVELMTRLTRAVGSDRQPPRSAAHRAVCSS